MTATSIVSTNKAVRYLKALVNHFNRKVKSSYEGNIGNIQFPFGNCQMEATEEALLIHIQSESKPMLEQTKSVVADHLIRFGAKDELIVDWQES